MTRASRGGPGAGRRRASRERGYVVVPVLVLATVFLLVIETSLILMTVGMRDSRRREAALEARQLALSGLDWGEACVAARAPGCGDVLLLPGGEVEVRVELGPGDVAVRAVGRVQKNGRLVVARTLSRRVPRPLDWPEERGRASDDRGTPSPDELAPLLDGFEPLGEGGETVEEPPEGDPRDGAAPPLDGPVGSTPIDARGRPIPSGRGRPPGR